MVGSDHSPDLKTLVNYYPSEEHRLSKYNRYTENMVGGLMVG